MARGGGGLVVVVELYLYRYRHRGREEIPVCGTRPPERRAHSAIDWIPVDDRKRGRSRKTRQSTFCDDLHARGVR